MNKNKLFVLDANTLISAFLLSTNTRGAQAYYKAKEQGRIVASTETFNEFADVFMHTKFDRYLSKEKRLLVLEDLKDQVELLEVTTSIAACRDPKDNKYLELAIEAGADCIITGDADLLVLHPFQSIPILTASQFLEQFKTSHPAI